MRSFSSIHLEKPTQDKARKRIEKPKSRLTIKILTGCFL